jgi:predicted peptidase
MPDLQGKVPFPLFKVLTTNTSSMQEHPQANDVKWRRSSTLYQGRTRKQAKVSKHRRAVIQTPKDRDNQTAKAQGFQGHHSTSRKHAP